MKNILLLVIGLMLYNNNNLIAQHLVDEDITFRIEKLYPPISISRDSLSKANTLQDLNDFFKDEWVSTYLTVNITAWNNGLQKTVTSSIGTLTEAQRTLMLNADTGKPIYVFIEYLPNNSMSHNDPKTDDFTFVINPENDAYFPGNTEALNKYIDDSAISKLSACAFEEQTLAAVQFTVSNTGAITNVSLYNSSKDDDIDTMLLKTISNMPDWSPAKYFDGTPTKQEYILSVGNIYSCLLNGIRIRN